MTAQVARLKYVEFAGATGAGVLGVGLGALLAGWVAPYAPLILETPLWSKALYWLCWIVLATLTIWIGLTAFRG